MASTSTQFPLDAESVLRRRVNYFFMNPCEKYKAKGKLPFKLFLQLIKLILVSSQLGLFGASISNHVDFTDKSTLALKHLYLKNWDPSFETMPYPPATGIYAVYTRPDFYAHINYFMQRYNLTEKISLGNYNFAFLNNTESPIRMCNTHYREGQIFSFNQSYNIRRIKDQDCYKIYPFTHYNYSSNSTYNVYDVENYLHSVNRSINFDSMLTVSLNVFLKTVHLESHSAIVSPDCYLMDVQIKYDNSHQSGQIPIDLSSNLTPLKCHGKIGHELRDTIELALMSMFDVIVICICFISLILCVRSLIKGHKLFNEVKLHLSETRALNLSISDRFEFINFWYIIIILNDFLTISGSLMKIIIQNKKSFNYDICSMLLGNGGLLVWFGVLRYLRFFKSYNILILTMKQSAPNVFRFIVCAGILYLGYAFCGWVILGPYHIKFRRLSTASECLFSLVNGDDMFVTFSGLDKTHSYIWWFSRLYLYTFISLFIYVVLSLFIAVILDTYEVIKEYYVSGFPMSEIKKFMNESKYPPSSPLYLSDELVTLPLTSNFLAKSRATDLDCASACCSCFSRIHFKQSLNQDFDTNLERAPCIND